MNIQYETILSKAQHASTQLESMRDLKSDLMDDVETFRMYLVQLQRALPDNERQPLVSLIQDVLAELERIASVNFDDMHYALYDVISKYDDIDPSKINRNPSC